MKSKLFASFICDMEYGVSNSFFEFMRYFTTAILVTTLSPASGVEANTR